MQFTLVGNEDGSANLTVYVEGQPPLSAHSSHPNFEAIRAGVFADDESVYDLFDIAQAAATRFERLSDRITSANGRLYLDSEEIHNALAEQIICFLKEGVEDWKPLVAFFENIQSNPNEHSREQLYRWIQAAKLTITEDGLIVGYKGVQRHEGGFRSASSGTAIVNGDVFNGQIPNPIGAIVEMPRSEVVHDPTTTCSTGLHVGTHHYASTFSDVTLEVAVHPRDVVSVPTDANGEKMRVCRYKVVKVLKGGAYQTAVKPVETKKKTDSKSKAKAPRDVKVGDVYEDADKRRSGRTFKVTAVGGGVAVGKSLPANITRTIKTDRLQSRKYKLIKKGR